jgi:hypothetical protein
LFGGCDGLAEFAGGVDVSAAKTGKTARLAEKTAAPTFLIIANPRFRREAAKKNA